jgi:hypothetical protein
VLEVIAPMPVDPDTSLALAGAVQRVAGWTAAPMPLSPGDIARAARRLEVAAHAEVERAVRRLREDGQGWRAIAVLLGLDQVTDIIDPAMLAFDYCAGLPTAPTFAPPRVCWDCPSCGQTVVDLGPTVCPASSEQGHAADCERLAADVG